MTAQSRRRLWAVPLHDSFVCCSRSEARDHRDCKGMEGGGGLFIRRSPHLTSGGGRSPSVRQDGVKRRMTVMTVFNTHWLNYFGRRGRVRVFVGVFATRYR